MVSVELGVEALREHLSKWGERLSIAAVNSPQSTLVSGDAEVLDDFIAELTAAEHFRKATIRGDYASHCAQIESGTRRTPWASSPASRRAPTTFRSIRR